MAVRKIIHVDMDAFYASIEQRDHPELRGKPVAVGGGSKRGVVASASYEARQFGVRSAMPSITAARLCPGLIFAKVRFDVYRSVSQQIREIFLDYTDLVEPLSLDEAYLDVTENKKGIWSAVKIAQEIRQRIFDTTQLTASAGVSINKFLAKVASDINKPNGLKLIGPEEAESFLEQLPVKKFHGVGKVTAEKMQRMGIYTGGDLKKLDEIEMVRRFGKVGRHYYKIVRAQDNRPVNPNRVRKSIGGERTFADDLNTFEQMWERLEPIAAQVYKYMKKSDNYGRTLSLKMKTPDFQIVSRSRTFGSELRDEQQFMKMAQEMLTEHWQQVGAVRLLGVSVSNLSKETEGHGIQLELDFEE
ncbi:MAG: DNA polymerase IV [Bacteroidota bacterium]